MWFISPKSSKTYPRRLAYCSYKYANLRKSEVWNLIYYLPPRDNILRLTPVMTEAEENVNSYFQDHLEGERGGKKKNKTTSPAWCSWELAHANNGELLTVSVLPKGRGPWCGNRGLASRAVWTRNRQLAQWQGDPFKRSPVRRPRTKLTFADSVKKKKKSNPIIYRHMR